MPAPVDTPQQESDETWKIDKYRTLPLYMNTRAQCKLLLQQAFLSVFRARESEDSFIYVRRQRLIQQITSAYSVVSFRSQIETVIYETQSYEHYRAWNWYLLFIWESMCYSKADSLHWMKLLLDHMFRMTEVSDDWEWKIVQSEMITYLKDNGTFVRFYSQFFELYYPKWVEIVRQMNTSVIQQYQQPYNYYNLLHTLKKVVWIWNFSHHLLKPADSLLSSRTPWDQIHQTSTRYNRRHQTYILPADSVISSRDTQIHARYVLLPLIHLEKQNLIHHVVLSNQLLASMVPIYQRVRKTYDAISALIHVEKTLSLMQKEREHISTFSTYDRDIQHKYKSLYNDIHRKQDYHRRMAKQLNDIIFNQEWYELIRWNLTIFRGVHWISNNMFQNIGFLMLPFAKVKTYTFSEHRLPKDLINDIIITAKQMYREHWGNITHLSQLYMFLSNSMYFNQTFSFVKNVLIDPRFGQQNHQVYESTQTYNTNMRIIFELLKSGIKIPDMYKTNVIQFIQMIFKEYKRSVNRLLINRINYRLTNMNLNRVFNTTGGDGNCLTRLYDMHISTGIYKIINIVEFFDMVLKWIVKQKSFSRIDVLNLAQMIRSQWEFTQTLSFTEQNEFLYGLNVQRYVTSNPYFTEQLLQDPDVDLEWWGLYRRDSGMSVIEMDDELDAITFIHMEHPVILPSGQKVDRSTYQLLLQNDGKDPFTREDLEPLSEMEQ